MHMLLYGPGWVVQLVRAFTQSTKDENWIMVIRACTRMNQ